MFFTISAVAGNTVMYESYYGFTEKPFSIQPDPAFLYMSKKHDNALSKLEYSILHHATCAVITGSVGSGKTTLIRELMHKLEENITVGLVSNVDSASFEELMQWILYSFELDYKDKGKVALFETFTDFLIDNYAANGRTVLIIDEAHNLDLESLEQLRMLLNINVDKHQVLQLILVGQPGLRDMLRSPALAQFAQRIEVDYFLQPLDEEETKKYIQHRLVVSGGKSSLFAPDVYSTIWRATGGVPRLINVVCDMALVYGFADQKEIIDNELFNNVLRDKEGGLSPIASEGSEFIDRAEQLERRKPRQEQLERRRVMTEPLAPKVKPQKQSVKKQSNKQKKLSSIEKLFK